MVSLLPPATKLGQGNFFQKRVSRILSTEGGGSPCPQPGGRLRGLAGGGRGGGPPDPHPGGRLGVWLGAGSPGPHPGGG